MYEVVVVSGVDPAETVTVHVSAAAATAAAPDLPAVGIALFALV